LDSLLSVPQLARCDACIDLLEKLIFVAQKTTVFASPIDLLDLDPIAGIDCKADLSRPRDAANELGVALSNEANGEVIPNDHLVGIVKMS
jgi:hypothetical protein